MLGYMNNSISNIFNTTNKSSTMLSSDHKCNDNNCQGPRFAGCNLKCSRCFMPKFIDCISDRTEIIELLKILNILPAQSVSNEIANDITSKLKSLFGPDSTIQFLCPLCVSEGSYLEVKLKYENKIKTLEKKIDDLKKEKKQLIENEKSNQLSSKCVQCTDVNIENAKLHDENEKLKADLNSDRYKNYDGLNVENARMQNKIDDLNVKLNEMKCNKCDEFATVINSVAIFTAELGDSIEQLNLNCEGFKEQIKKNKGDIVDILRSLNLCIPNGYESEYQVAGNDNTTTQQMNRGLNPDSIVFQQRENNLGANKNVNKLPLDTKNVKKDVNGNFIAPKPIEKHDSVGKLFAIYVSPFQTDISPSDIADHILQKTEIEDDRLFIVEKLIGRNEQMNRKSFVSYKISTFNSAIYKRILNENIWGPNQTARPFDSQPPKRKSFAHTNYRKNYPIRNYEKQYNNRSKYIPPPRFNNNRHQFHQQTNYQRQRYNNGYNHGNDNQYQRYRDNSQRYNAGNNHRDNDHRSYSNAGDCGRDDENRSNADSYRRGSNRISNYAAKPSYFLSTDGRSDKPRTNPFRMSRDDYQYRSTNSVNRM